LSRHLGPRDVQLSAVEETLEAGQRPPLRMLVEAIRAHRRDAVPLAMAYLRRRNGETFARACKKSFVNRLGLVPQHANADRVAAAFPDEWQRFFKFCVVRNPYDLAVSDYYWRTRNLEAPPGFETYLDALKAGDTLDGIVPVRIYDNWSRYAIDDRIVADRIIRFENLLPELTDCLRGLGLPFSGTLPRLKSAPRKSHAGSASYRDHYSARSKALVENLYAKELAQFEYRF
jgi:hypothetical protein